MDDIKQDEIDILRTALEQLTKACTALQEENKILRKRLGE